MQDIDLRVTTLRNCELCDLISFSDRLIDNFLRVVARVVHVRQTFYTSDQIDNAFSNLRERTFNVLYTQVDQI